MELHASNCVIGECNIVLVLFNSENYYLNLAVMKLSLTFYIV